VVIVDRRQGGLLFRRSPGSEDEEKRSSRLREPIKTQRLAGERGVGVAASEAIAAVGRQSSESSSSSGGGVGVEHRRALRTCGLQKGKRREDANRKPQTKEVVSNELRGAREDRAGLDWTSGKNKKSCQRWSGSPIYTSKGAKVAAVLAIFLSRKRSNIYSNWVCTQMTAQEREKESVITS
jgi:hypothetical protein